MRAKFFLTAGLLLAASEPCRPAEMPVAGQTQEDLLAELKSTILLRGNDTTAYRDPLLVYHDGTFYLFYSYVRTEEERKIYWYLGLSKSRDLRQWSEPAILTPKDQDLNYASPGDVVRFGGQWVLCMQTYPMPGYRRSDKLRFGDERSRVFIMRGDDLEHWGKPELLRVKGPDVSEKDMGHMIDPYLLEDKDEPGKWWCFFKQNGVSYSWSRDLKNWTFTGNTRSGENVCVLVDQGEYVLFHSPGNGIGVKRSPDLVHWRDIGEPITLGQKDWPWAEVRLTAGYVADLRSVPSVGKYVMVFHGMRGIRRTTDCVNANCSIGIAWSDDLKTWKWPED